MSRFAYVALDARGRETKGYLQVAGQLEALQRLRDMGFFPTRVVSVADPAAGKTIRRRDALFGIGLRKASIRWPARRVTARELTTFTRQLATLIEAGMPLLRGLRLLEEQEQKGALREILGMVATAIEGGSTLSEALLAHPCVFNRLYVNMVKAGELGGVLDVVLKRLAEFMEKAQKIKGRVVSALVYPLAVLSVAGVILWLLMVFVVPKFRLVFDGLLGGKPMPAFTLLILGLSETVQRHWLALFSVISATTVFARLAVATRSGRRWFDRALWHFPVIGPVARKVAISRFTRTLGTLVSSGVPILQALTIVRETSGSVVVGDAVTAVHVSVKEGETIAAPLRKSGVFPGLVIGMVDVGEQTGALPEMLGKIADNYDDEVDNAVSAMTSLLEPLLIVFLAVVVGSIVAALFMPLIAIMDDIDGGQEP